MAKNYLITGYWGEPHVTAENDRGIHAATFGTGRFVLPVGEQFKAEYIGNNTIRLYDGKLMNNGAAAGIPAGEYVDLLISNAGQRMNRNDLIIFQYSQDASTLIESGIFTVIQGSETSGTPSDPKLTQSDLLTGDATFDQMALWRVTVSGTDISDPVKLFDVSKSLSSSAPSGFGLGGISTVVSDLNTAISNGWYYYGASASNKPQYLQYGCLLVVNRSGTEVERVQLAFSPIDGTKAQRIYRNFTDGWSEWEYENPPMTPNVEYRTTEKWNGKPVYTQLLPIGSWAKGGTIDYGNISTHVIRYSGIIGNWSLPFINNATDNEYSLWATFYNNGGKLRLGMCGGTNADGSGGHIQIWYYKL